MYQYANELTRMFELSFPWHIIKLAHRHIKRDYEFFDRYYSPGSGI